MAEIIDGINLSAVAIGLGLEATEYEPEQFPGLVYRPTEYESVLLIFGSGKVIITGSTSIQAAEEAFNSLDESLKDIL
jgi:transcription initiation factor TFIID TATA-box-binding protein